jgi:hypothetical protein
MIWLDKRMRAGHWNNPFGSKGFWYSLNSEDLYQVKKNYPHSRAQIKSYFQFRSNSNQSIVL